MIIKNLTGQYNGYAIIISKDINYDDPKPIMSGLTYDQAEREYLRIKKEKETSGDGILQD